MGYLPLGVTITPENIRHCMTTSRVGDALSHYDFFFKASIWTGTPEIMEPEKCSDLNWFSFDELQENIIPYNKAVIDLVRAGITYAEEGVDF